MVRAMNDDVAGSSSQNLAPSPRAASAEPRNDLAAGHGSASDSQLESTAQRRKVGLHRKFQFMTHLMTNLDALVYAEVCVLYYMDCSFLRLLIRVTVQSFFLSPKSDEFVLLMPTHRPHVMAILVPNILCMLLHLLTSLPQASESTRGYLHGGVIIDFVGEKAPTSKLKLVVLDAAVLALQCIMMAVHAERERLRNLVKPASRILGTAAEDAGEAGATSWHAPGLMANHDSDERGVSSRASRASEASDGIELQSLRPRAVPEISTPLTEGSTHARRPPDIRDYMLSGNAILGDFHVLHSLRTTGNDYQSAAAQSLQSIGYAATLARLAAEPRSRLIRLRAQRRQQEQQQQQGNGMV